MNQAQQAEATQQAREDLYARVFNTEDGLRVLRDLASVYELVENPFSKHFDPIKAAVSAGQKEVVNNILKLSTRHAAKH